MIPEWVKPVPGGRAKSPEEVYQTKTFTVLGFIVLVVLFLVLSTGKYASIVVSFLGLVLLSMILLNWGKIEPLFLRRA